MRWRSGRGSRIAKGVKIRQGRVGEGAVGPVHAESYRLRCGACSWQQKCRSSSKGLRAWVRRLAVLPEATGRDTMGGAGLHKAAGGSKSGAE